MMPGDPLLHAVAMSLETADLFPQSEAGPSDAGW